ncbi:MAG TPA: AAA family ATPase [Candidatus Acidoferrales bacterium]|nr:AAA family ATPase [Candidatus Acidoferrales bacterium]
MGRLMVALFQPFVIPVFVACALTILFWVVTHGNQNAHSQPAMAAPKNVRPFPVAAKPIANPISSPSFSIAAAPTEVKHWRTMHLAAAPKYVDEPATKEESLTHMDSPSVIQFPSPTEEALPVDSSSILPTESSQEFQDAPVLEPTEAVQPITVEQIFLDQTAVEPAFAAEQVKTESAEVVESAGVVVSASVVEFTNTAEQVVAEPTGAVEPTDVVEQIVGEPAAVVESIETAEQDSPVVAADSSFELQDTAIVEPASIIEQIALQGATFNSLLLLEENVASSRITGQPVQENAPFADEIPMQEAAQIPQPETVAEIASSEAAPEISPVPAPVTAKDELLQRHLDFLAFYGLIESPFEVTPDPAYLYLSQFHQDALFSILQGVQNFRGFMALVAEPGLGKTTLLNKLNEELKDCARTVFVFQTQCNSKEFLGYLLSELGIDSTGMDVVAMHRALNGVLLEEMFQGRRFVLIVDEAQNLDAASLETIRLLSNFETTHSKLIQIILAGQPQLLETLKKPELAQLRQRIASLATLHHLDAAETAHYVEHRLHTAGSRDESIFTPDAMELIAQRSKGIPREINNVCFNALMFGYAMGSRTISAEIVQQSLAQMNFDSLLDTAEAEPAVAPEPVNTLTLMGRVTEKLRHRTWETNKETRILVSLEREATPGIPVADRYYCCSFYVNEEIAKSIEPNQQVKIKIEPR